MVRPASRFRCGVGRGASPPPTRPRHPQATALSANQATAGAVAPRRATRARTGSRPPARPAADHHPARSPARRPRVALLALVGPSSVAFRSAAGRVGFEEQDGSDRHQRAGSVSGGGRGCAEARRRAGPVGVGGAGPRPAAGANRSRVVHDGVLSGRWLLRLCRSPRGRCPAGVPPGRVPQVADARCRVGGMK